MKKTLVDLFEESVRTYPNNTFLLEKTNKVFEPTTYAEVKEKVYQLGAGLQALGVKKVYAITKGNAKREALAYSLGADRVFNLSKEGTEAVTKALQAENGGLGVDLCIECSGAPSAVLQGMEILRNRGVYLIPGQYSASGGIEIQPQMITFKALHIIGSSQYSMCDVRAYLEFLKDHPELTETIRALGTGFPVSKTNEAIAFAKAGGNVKTLLVRES